MAATEETKKEKSCCCLQQSGWSGIQEMLRIGTKLRIISRSTWSRFTDHYIISAVIFRALLLKNCAPLCVLAVNPPQQTVAIVFQQYCSGKVSVIDFVIECSHTFLLVHQILFVNVWNTNKHNVTLNAPQKNLNTYVRINLVRSIYGINTVIQINMLPLEEQKPPTVHQEWAVLARALLGSDVMHIRSGQMYSDGSCCFLAALCQ